LLQPARVQDNECDYERAFVTSSGNFCGYRIVFWSIFLLQQQAEIFIARIHATRENRLSALLKMKTISAAKLVLKIWNVQSGNVMWKYVRKLQNMECMRMIQREKSDE